MQEKGTLDHLTRESFDSSSNDIEIVNDLKVNAKM